MVVMLLCIRLGALNRQSGSGVPWTRYSDESRIQVSPRALRSNESIRSDPNTDVSIDAHVYR